MAIHRIRLLGDPVLRARCEPINDPRSTAVRIIADDLRETLRDWQSRLGYGRGIAAPQIGAPVRIVHIEMDRPWTLVNPEIVESHGVSDIEEGCLSVPGIYELVERAERVKVRAYDQNGNAFTLEAQGLLAVCIQHEMDHLKGKVFIESLSQLKQQRIRARLAKQLRKSA